ncbi:hypothetical protein HGA13_14135 [Nocardia speluncae]|uniref:Uncharacterized protein n=1 Tax=Nocardia speluncae TaxID=419477 RepID=A0A846XCW5_9NOCA|nr:hypothetical protein [Nocardia speluncae]NKY34211.1 hypothetical protein [Nocardia speluncae]
MRLTRTGVYAGQRPGRRSAGELARRRGGEGGGRQALTRLFGAAERSGGTFVLDGMGGDALGSGVA